MIRFDQRRVAQGDEDLGTRICLLAVYVAPRDVSLDRPASAIGGGCTACIKALRPGSDQYCHWASLLIADVSGQESGSIPCTMRIASIQRSIPKATHALDAGVPSASVISKAFPKKRSWLLNDAIARSLPSGYSTSSSCFSDLTRCSSSRPRAVGAKNGSVATSVCAVRPNVPARRAARS